MKLSVLAAHQLSRVRWRDGFERFAAARPPGDVKPAPPVAGLLTLAEQRRPACKADPKANENARGG
jgi:hypothetical protein